MTTTKFYDSYTLFVKSGVAYPYQISEILKKAVMEASLILGRSLETKFKTNLVMLKDHKPVGYGYIRVTNPEVYNILVGLNPDGTERVEYVDDPDWVAPSENDELTDWADEVPEECPKLKKYLPPLVTLKPYSLDYKQKSLMKDQILETARHEGTYKEGMEVKVETSYELELSPAFVYEVENHHCHNILCARKIPPTINEQMIKTFFTPFTTDSTTKVTRRILGKSIQDTYPFVTINSERIAFVTFDPKTRDAQFALLMTKKSEISDGQRPVTLIFTHSFKTK